jgi:hypothetical protein
MAGTVKASVLQHDVINAPPVIRDGAGTEIAQFCRAWMNYKGTTTTIQGSFNFSSVTKTATGIYENNFSVSFVDSNYCATYGSKYDEAGANAGAGLWCAGGRAPNTITASKIRTLHDTYTGTAYDVFNSWVSITR